MDCLKDLGSNGILIWDEEASCPSSAGVTVLWRSFGAEENPSIVSIPELIEKNAEVLRTRYLAWVFALGEMRIRGKRLVDHLQLRPKFSYWWMTLLVEKSNFAKSPQIDDAIRLLAFTDWAARRVFNSIKLASSNRLLAECLCGWCEKMGVEFEWHRLPAKTSTLTWKRRMYKALPLAIQAWIWLLSYLIERWPLRGMGLQAWRQTPGKTTFVTYSDNCDSEAIREGRYENRYWGQLPVALKQQSKSTNWLHLYVKDGLLATAKQAAFAIDAFNKSAQGLQCHVTLDSFIGLRVIYRTLRDWLRLGQKSIRLAGDLKSNQDFSIELWPLMRADWQMSILGPPALSNLLSLNLFEAALDKLPKQQRGVYLQENISWESGFVHCWREAGHGHLIGAPHSTVRFWDLRYFFDSRSYFRTGFNDLPMPDQVACNGSAMRAAYENGGYPTNDLVDVEALRYLHLEQKEWVRDDASNRTHKPISLLVLGDYLAANTQLQLKQLEEAILLMRQPMRIIVKPHPNCPVRPGDYPKLNMQVSMEPIAKLLVECEVAYASSATSAAVDAFCAGVPIISVLDPNTLNLSPLRGCLGPIFVSTPSDLADALSSVERRVRTSVNQPAYFTIDAQLPNWRTLLA